MQSATHHTVFDRVSEVLNRFLAMGLARCFAAMDLKRLRKMSDAELAYRGLSRDGIPGYVARRYAK